MANKKATSKKRSAKVVKNKSVKQIDDKNFVVVQEDEFYTFTNERPGPMFFKRENGEDDMFEGGQTKKDITRLEREALLGTKDYELGYITEESEEIDKINNKNAVNRKQIAKIFDRYKNNPSGLKKYISEIDSEITVKRFKSYIIEKDLPSSLSAFCDYRLKELEEKMEQEMEAPIDTPPSKTLGVING